MATGFAAQPRRTWPAGLRTSRTEPPPHTTMWPSHRETSSPAASGAPSAAPTPLDADEPVGAAGTPLFRKRQRAPPADRPDAPSAGPADAPLGPPSPLEHHHGRVQHGLLQWYEAEKRAMQGIIEAKDREMQAIRADAAQARAELAVLKSHPGGMREAAASGGVAAAAGDSELLCMRRVMQQLQAENATLRKALQSTRSALAELRQQNTALLEEVWYTSPSRPWDYPCSICQCTPPSFGSFTFNSP